MVLSAFHPPTGSSSGKMGDHECVRFALAKARLDLEDVRARCTSSPAALNQTVCALRFFYGVTLGRADLPEVFPLRASRASCR